MIEHEKTILFKGLDILIFINIIHQANRHVHSGLSLLCNDKQIEAAYHDNEGKDYLYIQM